ncbi:MAG TPA: type 1 glutamine amidotransferase [Tepidisphaeraceae bacterium]|jgi:putative glutamine amidotransferase
MGEDRPPIIGVTGPDEGGAAAWWFTRFAIWVAGGHAVRITPKHPRSIEGLDGLIVGGGADVDPKLYGEDEADLLPRKPPTKLLFVLELILFPLIWLARKGSGLLATTGKDARRDALELQLIGDAVARNLPVLGICRGHQLINVYFGGKLHNLRVLYTETPEVRSVLPRKRVTLTEHTLLARIFRRKIVRVNALHRQGVAELGRGLIVSGRDRNLIIQAIEHQHLPFVLGVQWHPEFLPQLAEQRAIFRGLVQQAKKCRRESPALVAA